MARLTCSVTSKDFDFDRVKPLLNAALAVHVEDSNIWDHVYNAVTEPTPPPQTIPSSLQQTPSTQNTGSFVNSFERRQFMEKILKQELGSLYVGVPNFLDTFSRSVTDLKVASDTVFRKCIEGVDPLFRDGWTGWSIGAEESDVLAWFSDLILKLEAFAGDFNPNPTRRRKLTVAQPRTPLLGSTGKRSMDIGFVAREYAYEPAPKKGRFRWSHIQVPGELKSNPAADIPSIAWIDIAIYVREVFTAQSTRRFVLAFTLYGSIMRVWEFDRLGGIASDKFDINSEDGALLFVTTVLGFLWIDEENLGFDPSFITSHGQQYIIIE